MNTMNSLEERYYKLSLKAVHENLKEGENREFRKMERKLNLEKCDQCNGYGSFYNPSIIGYGEEHGYCTKCKGTGRLNHSPELLDTLVRKIYTD